MHSDVLCRRVPLLKHALVGQGWMVVVLPPMVVCSLLVLVLVRFETLSDSCVLQAGSCYDSVALWYMASALQVSGQAFRL